MNQAQDYSVFEQDCIVALAASRVKGLNLELYKEAVSALGGASRLLKAGPHLDGGLAVLYNACASPEFLRSCEKDLIRWAERGIFFLPLGNHNYPSELAAIFEPPPIVFYRSNLEAVSWKQARVAIVGSRGADHKGCDFAYSLASKIAQSKNCVVSGLAYGIDAAAHSGAISAASECPTIAVLGCGLYTIYPARHCRLTDDILARGGVILSQFEPEEKPYPVNFLARNRIIAGLCDGVVVVQARQKSGALVTARYALEEGRDVLAVPGAPGDPRAEGTNSLLKSGAFVVTSAEDVFNVLTKLSRPTVQIVSEKDSASATRCRIVAALKSQTEVDYNSLRGKLAAPDFEQELLNLELSGEILRLPGQRIILRARA